MRRKFGTARSGGEFPQGEFISPEDDKKHGSPLGLGPVGRHDHAMDEIRYFAATVAGREELRDVVSAGVVERRRF